MALLPEIIESQVAIFACLPPDKAQDAYAMHLAYKLAPDALNIAVDYQNIFQSLVGEVISLYAAKNWSELNARFAKHNPGESNKQPFKDKDEW